MTAPTPTQVLAAVKRSGVRYELTPGWDDPKIAADGVWEPAYVIQHHTANGGAAGNAPSLNWVLHNEYHPIRACHFLIGRDGLVHVVYALKCYHAGKGGPGSWGDGPHVAQDSMNGRSYGIEVESKGTSTVPSYVDGFTPAQLDALARLDAVLLDLLGAKGEGRIINHRTWAPGRKTDTRYSDSFLQSNAKAARDRLHVPPPAQWTPGARNIGWLSQQKPQIRSAQIALDVKVTGTYLPVIDGAFRGAVETWQKSHPAACIADGTMTADGVLRKPGVIGPNLYRSILTRYPKG